MNPSAPSPAPSGRRSLRDLVEREAPVAPARATSIMVAVARELERLELAGIDAGEIRSELVSLSEDGTVEIAEGHGRPRPLHEPGNEIVERGSRAGASVGRLLFELLTGRPPLGRDDAFEPAVTTAFSPALCALVARSCSDAPGQWPDAVTWRGALEAEAGGLAPPLPPRQWAAVRRRRSLTVAGLALLALATLAVLLLAPGWWDAATEESLAAESVTIEFVTAGAVTIGPATGPVAQPARTSSYNA